MPYPGTVNNPAGQNSYGTAEREEPYGAIERRKVLTRLAPLPPNPALTAPRRAQQQATSKKKQQPQAPPAPPVQETAARQAEIDEGARRDMPEQAVDPVVDFWQQLAAEPGASQLVRDYALQAAAQR